MNRRKPCDLKFQQNSYIRHLKKIQQLMKGNSPNQKKAKQENRKVLLQIKNSHKLHQLSRSQQNCIKVKQLRETNNVNCQTIRQAESVVAKQIKKSMIKLPQRHPRKLYQDQIDRENQKLRMRLVMSKPYVLQSLQNTDISQRKLPQITRNFDFSRIYFESPTSLLHNKRQKIVAKLSKKKNKIILFRFVENQLAKILKQNQSSLVQIEVRYNGCKTKILSRTYEQISKSDIVVWLNYKQKSPQIQFRFYKAFNEKEQTIYRGGVTLDIRRIVQQQINNSQFCCLKEQVSFNDRKLGQIEIRAKAKDLMTRKIMNTVRNTIEQQQKRQNLQARLKMANRTEHIEYYDSSRLQQKQNQSRNNYVSQTQFTQQTNS